MDKGAFKLVNPVNGGILGRGFRSSGEDDFVKDTGRVFPAY